MINKIEYKIPYDKDAFGHIYQIINMINKKKYVGKDTGKTGCRWNGTLEGIIREYGYNLHLIRSMRKYDIKNFKRIVFDSAKDRKELNEKEKYWIAFYKSNNQRYGYNKSEGGDGGNTYINKTPEELQET
ncbi:hypothetical protein LCGC14_3048670 [marine sediment metagenome]|uniref:GIY-YIG domain-containing protein n=1 Tax=marine sediment metagenome TaxID=412755 RepID=A0A0F8XAM5_9ZZZZ